MPTVVDSWFSWAGFRLGLAVLACLLPVQVAAAQDLDVVFGALKALYRATDGDNWDNHTNWDTTSVPTATQLDSWYGVTYDGGDLELLQLPDNGLRGSIPPELGVLTKLDRLDLSNNQLTGPVIEWTDNSLDRLYLHNNQLTGPIPSELGNLSSLDYLYLHNNQLTGPIPSELGNASSLDYLYLHNNQLTGPIPSELTNLSSLDYLYLHNNQLTGPVIEWTDDSLDRLYLHNNQLTGPIPSELGNLSSLNRLDLSNNQLTGSIPSALGNASDLDYLYLHNNQLTGSIPSELTNLSSLNRLYLSNNQLTGPVIEWTDDSMLRLDLSNNQLSGPIPSALGNLSKLITLDLSNNQLTGSIPSALGVLTGLDDLDLSNNQLSGPIPSALGNLSKLITLDLSNNQLTGSIPSALGVLTGLDDLNLSNNQLSGSVPGELGSASSLEGLYLNGNKFTGKLPSDLTQLRLLRAFLWEDNDGLCAPSDATFQAWLAGIRNGGVAVGPDCAALGFTDIVADQVYTVGMTISDFLLPEASGGLPPYEYTFAPDVLPAGLKYDASTRTLSGTPAEPAAPRLYTYTVRDEEATEASQTFSIEVRLALAAIPDQVYVFEVAIEPLELPELVGGTDPHTYTLSPALPAGLVFDAESRVLSGTPVEATVPTYYTYTAADAVGVSGERTFSMEVRLAWTTGIEDLELRYGVEIADAVFPEAVGGTDPYEYTVSPDLPEGLVFDAESRVLSGTPVEATVPTYYTFTATDAVGASGEQPFRMEVLPMALAGLLPNQRYVYGVEITPWVLPDVLGGFGPFTYTLAPALPPGLVFDAQARVLSGTPGQATVPMTYTYQVEDALGALASNTFLMEVALALAPIANQEYLAGLAIPSLVLPAAAGGTDPYVYELSPAVPSGLVFDAQARVLSGTPTEAVEPTDYTYTATDAAGASGEQTFLIEVKVPVALMLEPVADQAYVYGQPIQALPLPVAVGGIPPHRYTLDPALPPGLTFDPDPLSRTLSGTPTAATAPVEYTYTVADTLGASVSQQFRIEVTLALAQIADQAYAVGEEIAPLALPAAMGGTDPYTYTLSPSPPPGLAFDAQTRVLSGTPVEATAPVAYTYAATDAAGLAVSDTFHIEVLLALVPIADQAYEVGEEIAPLALPAALGGTDPYTYGLMPDPPPGLAFDVQTRVLSGTPTAATAPVAYTYAATDAAGLTASDTFLIEVQLGLASIADQAYVVGEEIAPLALPAAMGGTDPYTYTLSPSPPPGLAFDAQTRVLSGTPTAVVAPADYTFAVEDAAGLKASRSFSMEVLPALMLPPVADQAYVVDREIMPLELPPAAGGRSPHRYTLHPDPPPGLAYDSLARTLSGVPTTAVAAADFTYAVEDAAGFMASQVFSIEVLASFMLPPVADQVFTIDEEIAPLALPAAMGGRSPYVYALSPDPPVGLLYDEETRTLSGTPTAVMLPLTFTYAATDAGGVTTARTFEITVGASEALIRDRAALIALHEATGGAHWTDHTNWLDPPGDVVAFTEEALDAWFGVTVSAGRVVGLALPSNNLRGALPEALGDLSELKELRLYGNSLEGTIPSTLGQLDSLRALMLHDNALVGAIPPSLGNLAALKQLHLHNNGLTEHIPPGLGNLSSLKQLWLYGNSLEGTIPSSVGQLDSLRGLLLHDNALAGPIPPALGDLALLEDLWLQGNALEGTIPPALGRLDSLRGLLLHDNQLTGTIPPELGALGHLQDLWLQGNRLEDTIPPALGRLDSLRGLLLHENRLTGAIPSELGDLGRLKWLQLQENALEGEIPSALGRLTQLERLQLEGNRLTGRLPDSLGQLATLGHLYVHDNALTGALPATLVHLTALKELFFGGPDQKVCAPVDAAYQAWLESLEAVRGPDCGSFGLLFAAPVLDQRYTVGAGIADLALPPAEGGTAPYHYALSPALPAGLLYDASARTLRGTPTESIAHTSYTFTAVDGTGSTGRLTFAITVAPDMADLLMLHGNYPNPFRGATQLEMSLALDARISVEVFDLLGRRVLQQAAQRVKAGVRRRLAIDAPDMVSGVYLYRVIAVMERQTLVRTGRMAVVR